MKIKIIGEKDLENQSFDNKEAAIAAIKDYYGDEMDYVIDGDLVEVRDQEDYDILEQPYMILELELENN